ncbi:ABC transporter ATP-binding protein [Pigmentiphaga kullae]|uniref:Amino acid/amide ABC transporter ATP-binding protein 1 (HAAT family) n=1 Tax=Pigmentiphaga kullae TaxID=151784 RepID=A0A4Q7NFU4_9BURK|nr:ABC transporter ATP-binding protein [Pigmentiphaga kullae]RZS81940.1 amino acid/amide ABC transporter ATP-binding protein 1 (HAAT family) [Pigmentiphaga kullae]
MKLVVTGLSKSFGAVRAVEDVGFTLEGGQMLALIGPNGAGKSTCFQCINGQLQPDAGRIAFDGRDVTRLSVAARARLGLGRTFQIAQVAASLSVGQHVALALAARDPGVWHGVRGRGAGADPAELHAWLERFDLGALAGRLCGELPYPELKRVELASALALKPRVLLMDEPTAGMTRADRRGLMAIVKQEAAGGLAVLFTEHSMDVVFGFADKVLVLVRGRVIAEGAPRRIAEDPAVRAAYLGMAAVGAPA